MNFMHVKFHFVIHHIIITVYLLVVSYFVVVIFDLKNVLVIPLRFVIASLNNVYCFSTTHDKIRHLYPPTHIK